MMDFTNVKQGVLAPPRTPPSVGRVVHYVTRETPTVAEGQHWAALVTAVYPSEDGASEVCALTLFPPGQPPYSPNEAFRQGRPDEPGTWHWPERV